MHDVTVLKRFSVNLIIIIVVYGLFSFQPYFYGLDSVIVDSIQWMELMSFRRKLWLAHDVEVIRVPGQNIGLSFGEVCWSTYVLFL